MYIYTHIRTLIYIKVTVIVDVFHGDDLKEGVQGVAHSILAAFLCDKPGLFP